VIDVPQNSSLSVPPCCGNSLLDKNSVKKMIQMYHHILYKQKKLADVRNKNWQPAFMQSTSTYIYEGVANFNLTGQKAIHRIEKAVISPRIN